MHSEHNISTETHGRYLLDISDEQASTLLLGFHGYAESADLHMQRLRDANIPNVHLCSVQGLHCFYNRDKIVASWMTRLNREHCINDNRRYIDAVLEQVTSQCRWDRLIVCGFSQGAAMAYRAAVSSKHPCHGVFINGGDIPPDIHDAVERLPPVCIVRGHDDSAYDKDKLEADKQRLQQHAHQVHEVPGSHAWSAPSNDALALFIASLEQ